MLLMLIIASSCEINSYQPNDFNNEKADVLKQEIKEEPSEWDIFVKALIQVESEGKADAVGKTNDVGILQITPIYVKDTTIPEKVLIKRLSSIIQELGKVIV